MHPIVKKSQILQRKKTAKTILEESKSRSWSKKLTTLALNKKDAFWKNFDLLPEESRSLGFLFIISILESEFPSERELVHSNLSKAAKFALPEVKISDGASDREIGKALQHDTKTYNQFVRICFPI